MVSNVVTKLSLSPPHPSIPAKKDERLWILSDLFKKEIPPPLPLMYISYLFVNGKGFRFVTNVCF